MKRTTLLNVAAALAVVAAPAAAQVKLTGAGATFPNIIYQDWILTYNQSHSDVQLNYQSIGSGGGIRQFSDKTVDFGGSDAPMTDSAIAAIQGNVLHIPTVLGAVVITYNLPGVTQQLKFTPSVVADIYLGKLTKWNDARIAASNPGVSLPNVDILVVHRSDGSGTTYIWTDYLSKVSPEWKDKVGKGVSVNWPVGLGGKGNEGVVRHRRADPGGDRLCGAGVRQQQQTGVWPAAKRGREVHQSDPRGDDGRPRRSHEGHGAEHGFPGFDHQLPGRGCLPHRQHDLLAGSQDLRRRSGEDHRAPALHLVGGDGRAGQGRAPRVRAASDRPPSLDLGSTGVGQGTGSHGLYGSSLTPP